MTKDKVVGLHRTHSRLTARELAQLFREIDLDEDGTLSRNEVADSLQRLRIPWYVWVWRVSFGGCPWRLGVLGELAFTQLTALDSD